jgi:hypothetical protein
LLVHLKLHLRGQLYLDPGVDRKPSHAIFQTETLAQCCGSGSACEREDPDPHERDRQDPNTDPDQCDKQDPDSHQSDADPQHCTGPWEGCITQIQSITLRYAQLV